MKTRLNLHTLVPAPLKPALRAGRESLLDVADRLVKHDADHPPRPLQRLVGDGDFRAVGASLLGDLVKHTALTPTSSVLDVGCGIGRVAVPLSRFLDANGHYEGFDIMPQAIEWCQKQITSHYPAFRFQLADIHSVYYNPKGTLQARNYVFPYSDEHFDVVFLTSIFTHLLPDDMEHYLEEIARVLKPSGRVLFTMFLLNESSLRAIQEGKARFNPLVEVPRGRIADPAFPEAVVAHDEACVRAICKRLDLQVEVTYGSWSRGVATGQAHDFICAWKQA